MSDVEIDPRPSGSGWISPSRRRMGAPIEQYGVLGDGRTVTLVAADGRIDLVAASRPELSACFAGLLGPEHGGQLTLRPEAPYTVTRR